MEHEFDLARLAIVAAAAALSGFIFLRLRQPALVGFIFAGVILGPTGFAIIEDGGDISLLAELGVVLLVFVVGLEISLRALRRSLTIGFICAVLQAVTSMAAAAGIGWLLDWPLAGTLVIGFVFAIASTAVGIKLLEQLGEARKEAGRVTVGVLIAQDLLVIPMLIVISSMGRGGGFDAMALGQIAVGGGLLAALVYALSRRDKIELPFSTSLSRDTDAGPLAAIAFCLVLASASALLGLSPAYGAFVAGLILAASTVRRRVLRVSLPLQSILVMVFFLSIGLMVDLRFVATKAPIIIGAILVILPAKTAVNLFALRLLGVPAREAVIASVAMAQLGEFGFVLAAAGLSVGAIGAESYQIALSVIALSLVASPFWMATARRIAMHPKAKGETVRELLVNVYEDELNWGRRMVARVRASRIVRWKKP